MRSDTQLYSLVQVHRVPQRYHDYKNQNTSPMYDTNKEIYLPWYMLVVNRYHYKLGRMLQKRTGIITSWVACYRREQVSLQVWSHATEENRYHYKFGRMLQKRILDKSSSLELKICEIHQKTL